MSRNGVRERRMRKWSKTFVGGYGGLGRGGKVHDVAQVQ